MMAINENSDQDREKWEAEIIKKMGITLLPNLPDHVIHVSTMDEWDKVIAEAHENNMPIVVYFSATWCLPCQYFAPIFQSVQSEFATRMYFVHVEIDRFPHGGHMFGIEEIPSIHVVFHNREIARFVGVMSEHILRSTLEQVLNKIT